MSMYYIGDFAFDGMYLEHHGIKGMQWGHRRWQYKDGSLTPEGYTHYGYGDKRTTAKKDFMKNVRGAYEKRGLSRRQAKKAAKQQWVNENAKLKSKEEAYERLKSKREEELDNAVFDATENSDDGMLDKYTKEVVDEYHKKYGDDGNSDDEIAYAYSDKIVERYLDDYDKTTLKDLNDEIAAADASIKKDVDRLMSNYVNADADTIVQKWKEQEEGLQRIVTKAASADEIDLKMRTDPRYQKAYDEESDKFYDEMSDNLKGEYEDYAKEFGVPSGKDYFRDVEDYKSEINERVSERLGYKKDYKEKMKEYDDESNDFLNKTGMDIRKLVDLTMDVGYGFDTRAGKADYDYVARTVEKYSGLKVNGKEFSDAVLKGVKDFNDEYDTKRSNEYFKEHGIDWNKKNKSYSELQKSWDSLLAEGRRDHAMPDLDSPKHPFRKKMYELSGNPDRPKEAKGFNFKKAYEAVEKLREQSNGNYWEIESKVDKILAEAIAKDLGYTPTKETVNFFEQIMYSD